MVMAWVVNGFHHTLKNGCPQRKNLTNGWKMLEFTHDAASNHVHRFAGARKRRGFWEVIGVVDSSACRGKKHRSL
jgi:hypothetical protein